MIVGNPEAAYNLCTEYLPDCTESLPSRVQGDYFNAGYIGINEDDILDREGLSPQQYLEFTERLRDPPPGRIEQPEDLVEPTVFAGPTAPGARGEPGETGPPGPSGLRGESGRDGLDGSDGVQGPPGNVLIIPTNLGSNKGPDNQLQSIISQAMQNLQGSSGPMGLTGLPGPEGDEGLKGMMGEDGPPGLAGAPGEMGPRGFPGPRGFNGLPGPPGIPGSEGSNGPSS